jgi:hypothetical protein
VDQAGDDRPDPRRLRDLLGRRGEQRVDAAQVLGQAAPRDLADALDAEREQDAPERPLLGALDPIPSSSASCSAVSR